jgi:hypothetical protein
LVGRSYSDNDRIVLMHKVVKYELTPDILVERTLFKSALVRDCVRYMYSRHDRKDLVILNTANDIVDTRNYVNDKRLSEDE